MISYEQFLNIVSIICQKCEDPIRNNPDFTIEDIGPAIDGVRFVPEYIEKHKEEVVKLLQNKENKNGSNVC